MKLGLVFEGGGHRTIFSCGVMDALLDLSVYADYCIGSSAGIGYAISYVARQRGRNRRIFEEYLRDPRYSGLHHWFAPWERSYFSGKFLFATLPNRLVPFDYANFSNYGKECYAVLTKLATGQAEYRQLGTEDRSWRVLFASCSLPLVCSPVKIDGTLYADGCVADSVPYQMAIENGCDRVIVVLTRPLAYRKQPEPLMNAYARSIHHKYPEYAEAIRTRHARYNACLADLRAACDTGSVYVIAPEDTLGVGRAEKRRQRLMALYAQGYARTMQQSKALQRYLHEEVE